MNLLVDYRYVQAALFLQLVLWLKLYHYPVELGRLVEALFYLSGGGALALIYFAQPRMGFFTPWLLIQYTAYIMASVAVFRTRFNFRQALCLGFLMVFLNSFYWEFFYHVYEFQLWWPASLSVGWWYLRLPQWLRAVPALFLFRNFDVRDLRPVAAGLVVSFALTYALFSLRWGYVVLHPVHRIICLVALVYTVYKSPERV